LIARGIVWAGRHGQNAAMLPETIEMQKMLCVPGARQKALAAILAAHCPAGTKKRALVFVPTKAMASDLTLSAPAVIKQARPATHCRTGTVRHRHTAQTNTHSAAAFPK